LQIAGLAVTSQDFKDTRVKLGWTQEQIAEKLGLSVRTVKYYEAGRVPVSVPATKLLGLLAGDV
jgi:transcriptional regulator with XRE-family HTH domain